MNGSMDIYRYFAPSRTYNYTSQNTSTPFKAEPVKSDKNKINFPVIAASAVGTMLPMLLIGKKQGKNLFNIEYGLKEILLLGAGSITGGFLGGTIKDKGKNFWKKVREANYQFITNILTPMLFVELFKNLTKNFKNKQIAGIGSCIAGIATGVPVGSFISNQINKRYCSKDGYQERKIKLKDFLIQVDDVAAGLTLTKSLPLVDKILPFVYLICGYETGNKK